MRFRQPYPAAYAAPAAGPKIHALEAIINSAKSNLNIAPKNGWSPLFQFRWKNAGRIIRVIISPQKDIENYLELLLTPKAK